MPLNKCLISIAAVVLLSFNLSVHADDGCHGKIEIKSMRELDSIRDCQVIDGSVTIQNITSAQDSINLSRLQQVRGDLVIDGNSDIAHVVLANLKQVEGDFKLQNNRQLKHVDVSQLTTVKSMEISVQPALDAIQFPSGLSQIDSFKVTDTLISKIDGLTANKMNDIHIANNVYLKNVNLSRLQKVGGVISIAANAPGLSLDLTALSDIYQGDFRNLDAVTGLNRIHEVTGDLSFIANTFSSLSLPNMTQVAGTLTVSNNKQLHNFSVPQLQLLGGAFSLANNTELAEIDAPKLRQVDGTVDVTGNFNKIGLSSLVDVRGGLNVQTSSTNFSCDDVNKLKGGVTKGHEFTCKSNVSNPKSGIQLDHSSNDDSSENNATTTTTTTCYTSLLIFSIMISLFFF